MWDVHSCWSSRRIYTCRCRCEGAWALSLLRRIKWCSTKDALELQCEWKTPVSLRLPDAPYYEDIQSPLVLNKGSLRRVFRGPPMWQGSLEYYLSLASSRDPHIPHLEPVERVRWMYKPPSFLCFPFSLSHTCINTHSTHAPVGSPRVNAMRSIPDSNAHFIAPIRAADISAFKPNQRSSYVAQKY